MLFWSSLSKADSPWERVIDVKPSDPSLQITYLEEDR